MQILGPLARAEQKADRKRSSGAEPDLTVIAPAEAKPDDPAVDPAKGK